MPQQFHYTFDDLTQPRNQVRAIVPDTREIEPGKYRFADEELDLFLRLEGGVIYAAAALALETRAADKADSEGYVKTYAIEVDGAKPAGILLARAKTFREQATVADDDDGFDTYP